MKQENLNKYIIDIYLKELENSFNNKNTKTNFKVEVRSIHNNRDICFNNSHREILYSIIDCLDENSRKHANFKECVYGKALNIPVDKISTCPNFKKILNYYLKHYLERLSYIDKKIKNKKLILEKNNLYSFRYAFNCIYINLPIEIKKIIFDYLKYLDLNKCLNIRNKYELEIQKYSKHA